MVDPLLSLAFSVYENPGVYALLLGSGVSRSAGIPTGYEVILELIQRIANLRKVEVSREQLEEWFSSEFSTKPTYGTLLKALAPSQAERSRIMRGFFEPNEEEREDEIKLPTAAHHAISNLVERGYIRVIVTTNFDRLIEQSLEARGIVPAVIASKDAAKGALPLAHSRCTIIKVHGDYLDARIKNTPEELSQYDATMNRLLGQVFDEYGLIVCGWSCDWDPALRSAIERTSTRRFTTFWTSVGMPSQAAQQLIHTRCAVSIHIQSADKFFQVIDEQVASLAESVRRHPLTSVVAVQSVKRYLPDPVYRIRLYDLIVDETNRVVKAISLAQLPIDGVSDVVGQIPKRVNTYCDLVEVLLQMLVAGAFHGRGDYDELWGESIRLVSLEGAQVHGGNVALINLLSYPALLLYYGVGVAAVIARQYSTLAKLFIGLRRSDKDGSGRDRALVLTLTSHAVMSKDVASLLRPNKNEYTPVSNHLHERLWQALQAYAGDQAIYDENFDRFEYLLCLTFADESANSDFWKRGGPVGRFGWRRKVVQQIEDEIAREGSEWPPLAAGLFGGSIERVQVAVANTKTQLAQLYWY